MDPTLVGGLLVLAGALWSGLCFWAGWATRGTSAASDAALAAENLSDAQDEVAALQGVNAELLEREKRTSSNLARGLEDEASLGRALGDPDDPAALDRVLRAIGRRRGTASPDPSPLDPDTTLGAGGAVGPGGEGDSAGGGAGPSPEA